MDKRRIIFSAITSILQVIVASVTLIILYRFLLKTIGVAQLGVWSLVLATASMARLAGLGLSDSIVKYVAKYNALGKTESVSLVIQTSAISVGFLLGLIAFIAYPIAKFYLSHVIAAEFLHPALSILPYAFISFWLMMITSTFQAGLYGCQLIHLRNYILMGDSLIYLALCFILAPKYGLIGLAYARVIQNVSILILTWILLKIHISSLPFIPFRWSKIFFRETIGYAANFQIISILIFLCDPATKGFLSHFGSVTLVGYYEMANRMIQQIRELLVSANQVLVPEIATLAETKPEAISSLYKNSYEVNFYIILPTLSFVAVSAPTISVLWIGNYQPEFVQFVALLALGWFVNTLNVPAYFVNLGVGYLRWNVVSHFVIATLNLILGYFLGASFGGIGVVFGWVISLMIGSAIITITFHSINKIPFHELLPKTSEILAYTCLFGIIFSYFIYGKIINASSNNWKFNLVSLFFVLLIIIPAWINKMRKKITNLLPMLLNKSICFIR